MHRFSTSPKKLISQIRELGAGLRAESNATLREHSLELRHRAQLGQRTQQLLPMAYALVIEAADRVLGMRHYDVQVLGGIHLANRRVVEMQTGQGKTLTATLPLYLHALAGNGAHLATSNDYLAERDAETMSPVFDLLGLSCGLVVDSMTDSQRRASYACDITYGSSPQFGFDFLRDRMKSRAVRDTPSLANSVSPVQRDLHFVLADEADALLIDEANTPLVIGAAGAENEEKQAIYTWAAAQASSAREGLHFRDLVREQRIELTKEGRNWARAKMVESDLRVESVLDLYVKLERAILAHRHFHRDQHYLVRSGEIVLINQATGRLGEGRQWQDGIHQAIQAAESLPITTPTAHAAKLTIQGLFLAYRHIAGMTGTAVAARQELKRVYKMQVVSIPPRTPSKRMALPSQFFKTAAQKWQAIVAEIAELHAIGRPVLVGTRSVEKSDHLSHLLGEANIPHRVLNAREHKLEAEIIATAGQSSQVVVATSMAGRGTDIVISDEVRQLGGLHVIITELHDSPRQDQQLYGRCGRQGDPGTYRIFQCPTDEVLAAQYGEQRAARLRDRALTMRTAFLQTAQRRLERRRRQSRLASLHQEKRRMRAIWEAGLDPLLDTM